jgi:CRP-like cAMP-binding protein
MPELTGLSGLELRSLSAVVADEEEPSAAEERQFLEDQLHQAAVLLSLSRVRPAEFRLLQLLEWLAGRFGTMTGQGVLLSFGEKPLTHQQLADIAGVTRVTVTKALCHYRRSGVISAAEGGSLRLRIPSPQLGFPALGAAQSSPR